MRPPEGTTLEEITDLHWKAFKLYSSGASYRDIAAQLNIPSHTTPRTWVRAILKRAGPHPDIQEYLSRQMAEMQIAREQVMRVLVSGGTDDVNVVQATAALLKLHESEREVIGWTPAKSPYEEVKRMTDSEIKDAIQGYINDRDARRAAEQSGAIALPAAGETVDAR